jgi:hypothetical protein
MKVYLIALLEDLTHQDIYIYIYIYREREREREREVVSILMIIKDKTSCARILRNDRFDNFETLKKNRFDEK